MQICEFLTYENRLHMYPYTTGFTSPCGTGTCENRHFLVRHWHDWHGKSYIEWHAPHEARHQPGAENMTDHTDPIPPEDFPCDWEEFSQAVMAGED